MKKLFHIIIVLFPMIAHSQSWTEAFDLNDRGWDLVADKDCSRKNENGKYVLKTFKEGSGQFSFMPGFFDVTKDFILEASFIQRDGSINNGIGLFWGYSGKMYNEFIFTTNGYYKLGEQGVDEWVKTDLIKPLNEENTLRLEKKGSSLSYFLNAKLLTTNQVASYGFRAGFINYTNMTLETDNFHFAQENKMKLAANMPTGLVKENLGSGVNSTTYDLLPNISVDGRMLYFVRKYHEQNVGGKEDASDIWVSEWANGQWSTAKNVGVPVNSSSVDNLTAVSAGNNTIFLIRGS